jgi:hypothetical protein
VSRSTVAALTGLLVLSSIGVCSVRAQGDAPASPGASKVIDVGPGAATVSSFDALWADYKRADCYPHEPQPACMSFLCYRWGVGSRACLRRQRRYLHRPIPIAATNWSGKPVSLPDHSFQEAWLLRVVAESHANFPNCDVDAVIDVEENILTPKAVRDLLAQYQFPASLDQQNEQFHGQFFQADAVLSAFQSIPGLVEREIGEMKFLRRTDSHISHLFAEIMPQDDLRSKLIRRAAKPGRFRPLLRIRF